LHTAAVRRLTGDVHLTSEFATTWRAYQLDDKTRALLAYATKLTESPAMLETSDFDALSSAGWDEDGIYEATTLTGFFNFSGRLEAAAALLPDTIAADANPAEVRP
jgi:alkylhydroperoxidase family enzyme